MRGKGTFVYGLMLLSLTFTGCGSNKPVLGNENFAVDVERGSNNPVLVVRPRATGTLEDVEVEIRVYMEDQTQASFKRSWSYWDEPKRFDLAKGAKVERVELIGAGNLVVKNQKQ